MYRINCTSIYFGYIQVKDAFTTLGEAVNIIEALNDNKDIINISVTDKYGVYLKSPITNNLNWKAGI